MIKELLKNWDASVSKTTNWFLVESKSIDGKMNIIDNIQIIYLGVVGIPLNGTLVIEATNNTNGVAVLTTININALNNTANTDYYQLVVQFKFIRAVYTANAITGGDISAIANTREL